MEHIYIFLNLNIQHMFKKLTAFLKNEFFSHIFQKGGVKKQYLLPECNR